MADTYKTVRGDTLGKLAKQWGTTVDAIMAANPDITNRNQIGTSQTIIIPGASTTTTSSSTPTDTTSKKIDLHGVPGEPDVYKIGASTYLVYEVPNTEPPILLRWLVPPDEVEALFGPDVTPTYNQTLTGDEATAIGMLDFGTSTELANFDEDPFLTWAQTMETQAAVQPWILDDDYQALVAMAMLEGRTLTEAEIQSTEWWQENTEAEREWMKLYHGDPLTAETRIDDNRIRTLESLRDAGIDEPSESLVNYMADQVTMGGWSPVYYQSQITAVADPFSEIDLDAGVTAHLGSTTGVTEDRTEDVRNLVREWLGPVHGDWDENRIQKWAGTLRNNADGEEQLMQHLRNQRVSLYPTYEDEFLSYEDIAQPWRTFGTRIWGQTMDETDPIFSTMLQNNDQTENAKLLRREGLNRGIGAVTQSLQKDVITAGGTVRRAL